MEEQPSLLPDDPAQAPKSPIWSLEQGDAVSFMKGLDDGIANIIITDAPYESLEKHRSKGTTTRLKESKGSSNKWFEIFRNERFPELLDECYRVLAKDSHMYFMCDEETADVVKPMAREAGFTVWKSLVWLKMTKDMSKVKIGMGYHWRECLEYILFFEKGKRKLNNLSLSKCLQYPSPPRKGSYPTQKPWEIPRDLICNSTDVGELVIDPFTGSSPVGLAALRHGRSFIGNDLSGAAIAASLKTMEEFGGPVPLTQHTG